MADTFQVSSTVNGVMLPSVDGSLIYYYLNDAGSISRIPEAGWASRPEGIKLLCDAQGKPIGFPLMPAVGPSYAQRAFTEFSLNSYGNGPTVHTFFYDNTLKEIIVDTKGNSHLTFDEYMHRGPDNVYIGIVNTLEIVENLNFPPAGDAPLLPYMWIKPVYGVEQTSSLKITLDTLSPNLGPDDMWPVPIKTGAFTRKINIPYSPEHPISGYLSHYQNQAVTAYYSVPESESQGWSSIYGPSYYDIRDEHPIILDDTTVQVKNSPIALFQYPTATPSLSDPVLPIFSLYKRASFLDPWVEIPFEDIRDYNSANGQIVLVAPVPTSDSRLLKIDYTTHKKVYFFKQQDGTHLNLNPYMRDSQNFVGQALHIYILPHYILDGQGNTIQGSTQTHTLRFTIDPGIFDPLKAEYNPVALQIGVIYLSTAISIQDLIFLDSRKRGGGFPETKNTEEIMRVVSQASAYWDISFGSGLSYQSGGFVVIRLPTELHGDFAESEIISIIERNISAGVKFKIEDLNGMAW